MTSENAGRFGLPAAALGAICFVLSRFPGVDRAVIFGSRAKGNHRPGSDIDLAIEGDDIGIRDLLAIETAIDDLMLPYQMDLLLRAQIEDAALQAHIERVGQVLYQRKADAVRGERARP